MTQHEHWLADAKKRHGAGRWDGAEALYRRVLTDAPDHAEVLHLLGTLFVQMRRYDEAVSTLEQALTAGTPHVVETLNNIGVAHKEAGRLEEALAASDRAIAVNPGHVDTLNNRGILFFSRRCPAEAEACYRAALEREPNHLQTLNNISLVLRDQRRYDEALEFLARATRLHPGYVEAHNNEGVIWQQQRQYDRAVACYRRALRLRPDDHEALLNLGVALVCLGDFNPAEDAFRHALSVKPDYVDALNNLGNLFLTRNRPAEAHEYLAQALALNPDHVTTNWNRAITFLIEGDLRRGFEGYEWRFEEDKTQKRMFPFPPRTDVPMWDGGPLEGKRLWVRCEQGAGDMFQFVRFLPELKRRGAEVLLECPPELVSVLTDFTGVDDLIVTVPDNAPPPAVDAQVYIMSLPHRLGITQASLPAAPVPYLHPSEALRDEWGRNLVRIIRDAGLPSRGLKVGVVWAGNPTHGNDHNRSMSLADLLPLADVPGVVLFSLQKGARANEAATPPTGLPLVNLDPIIFDFTDTAAILSHLDLVITVDTSVVHLAGAVGCPVWTLLPHAPDWRWMLERPDSPWYPTMRLYRQPVPRDWGSVVRQVAGHLRARSAGHVTHQVEEAEAMAEAGRTDEAMARLSELTGLGAPSARACNDLGALRWRRGQRMEALDLFVRALELDPHDPAARQNCAQALDALGHPGQARALLHGSDTEEHPVARMAA